MSAGEIIGLLSLAAILAAILWGRRRGKAAFQGAMADAKAEGRAELAAELRASAVATGGSVNVHLGTDQRVSLGDTDAATAVVRAELQRMDALQRRRVLESLGVGELLDGLQHGQAAPVPHLVALPARGAGNGNVPHDGAETVTWMPETDVQEQ